MVYRLSNTIQPYAWGSKDALAELYGFERARGEPMAELWMGAHPRAVSRISVNDTEVGLDAYIAEHPDRALGPAADRFDSRLPFLFKILCAAAPLSIQVHPTLEQASVGFAAEDAAGVDRDAPERNYRDDNHKPELICAIRPFWGLRGFRSVADIRDELTTVEFRAADARPTLPESEDELKDFFRRLLSMPEGPRRELIAAAVSLSSGRWPGGRPETVPEVGNPLARYYWVLRIAEEYPGDIGILSPLLLNVFSLRPGEATYQPAGVLHAYLHGVGAELMANSDNVLRGGMTVKHIDIDELMTVGRFRSDATVVLSGEEISHRDDARPGDGAYCREIEYPTSFDEFAFSRLVAGGDCHVPAGTAQILFCHAGPLSVRCDGLDLDLSAGESVFVDAASEDLRVFGAGELFRARVPDQS